MEEAAIFICSWYFPMIFLLFVGRWRRRGALPLQLPAKADDMIDGCVAPKQNSPQNSGLLKGHMKSYDITTSCDKKIVLNHGLPKLNDAHLLMLVGSCRTCANQKIVGFPARTYSGRPFLIPIPGEKKSKRKPTSQENPS